MLLTPTLFLSSSPFIAPFLSYFFSFSSPLYLPFLFSCAGIDNWDISSAHIGTVGEEINVLPSDPHYCRDCTVYIAVLVYRTPFSLQVTLHHPSHLVHTRSHSHRMMHSIIQTTNLIDYTKARSY